MSDTTKEEPVKRLGNLSDKWRKRLDEEGWPQLSDFCYSVQWVHGDGTMILFHNAAFYESKRWKEILVATEHCGYFVLSTLDSCFFVMTTDVVKGRFPLCIED